MQKLIDQLKRHEGIRLKPYKCTEGKLTIGYGRNLEDVGISQAEADQMLMNDILKIEEQIIRKIPVFHELSLNRQNVLINMGFNLGVNGLLRFKKMIAALEDGNFVIAADEMDDSRWSRQVSSRADELSSQMIDG